LPANPTPGSLLFKWNARKHYACPSTHNDFAGYNVRHLILDSGCSSLLLPITSDADLVSLTNLFRDGTSYEWEIGVGTTGPMSTCTLTIKSLRQESFVVTLCRTTTPYVVHLPRLRFVVGHQDALTLLQLHNDHTLNLVGVAYLQTFVMQVSTIAAAMPGIVIGDRRDYALIGQDLLYGRYVFESGDLAMVCVDQASAPPQAAHPTYINICLAWINAEFDTTTREFDFIDNKERGDIPELDEYLVAVDE
jgi:hypothetical protein